MTKDRNTAQVNISLEGKKRAETGGLAGTLTIAENAFVRLTSNIDVPDGLANGVRGIITRIMTNDQGCVTAILVKFDDRKVGDKAKGSSQYKSQYLDAVPIYRQEYLSSTKTLPYSAANSHLYYLGQVLSTRFKVSPLTELLSIYQKYLLQDKLMWHSAE